MLPLTSQRLSMRIRDSAFKYVFIKYSSPWVQTWRWNPFHLSGRHMTQFIIRLWSSKQQRTQVRPCRSGIKWALMEAMCLEWGWRISVLKIRWTLVCKSTSIYDDPIYVVFFCKYFTKSIMTEFCLIPKRKIDYKKIDFICSFWFVFSYI